MTIELTKTLINLPSISPDDGGCQSVISSRLQKCGFVTTKLRYSDVDNLWMTHGKGDPVFCFLGHTDVVPPGPLQDWQSDPFVAEERDEYLYGRGAADMKGSVAAMVIALERYVSEQPQHPGTLALLLTSDEEGEAVNGTVRVMKHFAKENIKLSWCLVGEPSSRDNLGDVVKVGRRGSLGAKLVVKGIQGHVAYPDLARNPVHQLAPALTELCSIQWDQGNEFYPPTSFQVSNINAGTGAVNVIPGELEVLFNFRFSTESSDQQLMRETEAVLKKHNLDYDIEWRTSGQPFLTQSGELISAVTKSISTVTGRQTELSTSGGTSDGRFVAPTGAEVVELGPVNATIHKTNECVKVSDLETLTDIYHEILNNLFSYQT
ncbi:MAG: succinyl-diaminopimelate desuccinylase [Gammaproteobacteria bacterium]|nr:succinyl-diaminopimelate desuccinylase [Gammaproteobacteria bacterium]